MKLLSINCAGGQNVICALSLSEGELKSLVSDSEVLIFQSGIQISAELLASASTLRLLLRAGSGFDNVDLDYVQRKAVIVWSGTNCSVRDAAQKQGMSSD